MLTILQRIRASLYTGDLGFLPSPQSSRLQDLVLVTFLLLAGAAAFRKKLAQSLPRRVPIWDGQGNLLTENKGGDRVQRLLTMLRRPLTTWGCADRPLPLEMTPISTDMHLVLYVRSRSRYFVKLCILYTLLEALKKIKKSQQHINVFGLSHEMAAPCTLSNSNDWPSDIRLLPLDQGLTGGEWLSRLKIQHPQQHRHDPRSR